MRNLFLIHCVKSVLIWSYSGPYSVRLREIRTRIISHTNTFHAERKDLANEIVVIWKQANLEHNFIKLENRNSNAEQFSKENANECLSMSLSAITL